MSCKHQVIQVLCVLVTGLMKTFFFTAVHSTVAVVMKKRKRPKRQYHKKESISKYFVWDMQKCSE